MALFRRKKTASRNNDEQEIALSEESQKQKDEQPAEMKTPAVSQTVSSAVDGERVLIQPRITEKATLLAERGVYVFEILPQANKKDVESAIRAVYNIVPRKVRIVKNSPQKFLSRMRGRKGTQAGLKKAYVYLKEGDRIDIV